MASLKEIARRLKSVRNTRKITYAMKLVSAAKLRKAQEAVLRSRQYTEALDDLWAEVLGAGCDCSHVLMEAHAQVKNVRLLVVGGSRGLCGAYNTNVHRKADAFIASQAAARRTLQTILLGKKPADYFRRMKRSFTKSFETLPEDPNLWPLDDLCLELEHDFSSGKIDEVYIVYTRFRSAISTTAVLEKLLPLDNRDMALSTNPKTGITLFEPSANEVFAALLPRVLRSKVQQACLEAKASEQGMRMTAMDAATKNAGELDRNLTLTYNQLRQLSITSELLDIIGGAEALK